ncbi:hypothetical protein MKEN_00587600 [Mycena kentingensis (nom. inval.)]|nr:hypothetical protein MKEN_00587600 [Mycena kentingensis (nom. inval.)]
MSTPAHPSALENSSESATMTVDVDRPNASAPLLGKTKAQRELEALNPRRISWRAFLLCEVEPEHTTAPLLAFCFMTGFMSVFRILFYRTSVDASSSSDAISFSAAFVWCGFQTGNFAQVRHPVVVSLSTVQYVPQLALAVARILGTTNPADRVLLPADILALTSLLAFNFGAFTGGRIGDRIGAQTRAWLVSGTLLQAALTFGAGLCVQLSGEESVSAGRGTPAWTSLLSSVAMGLMAASLGVQGVIGKRLGTNFSTTVVLTALWIELVADPHLFKSPTRRIASRDHRALALFVLFGGAIIARLMLGQVGAAATLGFATGLRMLIAASWLFVKGKGEGYVRLWDEQEAEAGAGADQTPNYGTVVP